MFDLLDPFLVCNFVHHTYNSDVVYVNVSVLFHPNKDHFKANSALFDRKLTWNLTFTKESNFC